MEKEKKGRLGEGRKDDGVRNEMNREREELRNHYSSIFICLNPSLLPPLPSFPGVSMLYLTTCGFLGHTC